ERSPALVARQQAQLGPLAARVSWTRADLSHRAARDTPWAEVGMVVANEVLDCLAHHQIVRGTDGAPRVVFVVPRLGRAAVPAPPLRGGARGRSRAAPALARRPPPGPPPSPPPFAGGCSWDAPHAPRLSLPWGCRPGGARWRPSPAPPRCSGSTPAMAGPPTAA